MHFKQWRKHGEHWIWLNALATAICLLMVFGLIGFIMVRGLAYFWPSDIVQYQYTADNQSQTIAGEEVESIWVSNQSGSMEGFVGTQKRQRIKLKVGNRDIYGTDFRWVWADGISAISYPPDYVALEREEWGNFYGRIEALLDAKGNIRADSSYESLAALLPTIRDYRHRIAAITRQEMNAINASHEKIRLEQRGYELDGALSAKRLEDITARKAELDALYLQTEERLNALQTKFNDLGAVRMQAANGEVKDIPLNQIYKVWRPNSMSLLSKMLGYWGNIWSFLSETPREANTEGGVFPAIFGTVIMVFLMTIITTPLGVIAAIYISEYAKQGAVIRLVRICVNNLAGVPSVVYGVFGLGFFVYFIGGGIDSLLYKEALPAPTFGSPGILWASVTLALLTLPVVIVSAEEGFARIPKTVREGSMALGATKFETIFKVLLPMSTPAIMTGVILAIARAAGEVAPLMLVGVVKLAPDLVIDATAPFIHLDRKFMHLGFHIYDVGFQSPNVDASTPLVFATAFLLLLIIIVLNITAIMIRNRLRERYKQLEI